MFPSSGWKIKIVIIHLLLVFSKSFVIEQNGYRKQYKNSRGKLNRDAVCLRQSQSLLAMIPIFEPIFEPYARCLEQHPLLTKATTGFVLCGIADIIAQVRNGQVKQEYDDTSMTKPSSDLQRKLNTQRLARFATKGFFGAVIWGSWYDVSDAFLSTNNISLVVSKIGFQIDDVTSGTAINALRTASAIIIEQFVACPIIFGMWEIPAATLLNNSSPTRIPYEIEDKLGDMLIANAKVWTVANLIIYNIPVQYRVGFSNIIDIFWQSIVSDFAANCREPEVIEKLNEEKFGDLPHWNAEVISEEPESDRASEELPVTQSAT